MTQLSTELGPKKCNRMGFGEWRGSEITQFQTISKLSLNYAEPIGKFGLSRTRVQQVSAQRTHNDDESTHLFHRLSFRVMTGNCFSPNSLAKLSLSFFLRRRIVREKKMDFFLANFIVYFM